MPSALVALALLAIPAAAFAHASPVSYLPAASAELERAPDLVVIRFSERAEPAASDIAVYGPNGAIHAGKTTVDPADPRSISVALGDAGTGTYTVSWQTVSADDGHFTKGAYSFFVGTESDGTDGAQFQVVHRTKTPEAAAIWLELLGHAMLLGGLLLLACLWRPLQHAMSPDARTWTERRLSRFIKLGCGGAVLGGALYLLLGAQDLSATLNVPFSQAMTSLTRTNTGAFALYRMLTATAASLVWALAAKRVLRSQRMTRAEWVLLALVAVLALLRARVSHAAASHLLPELSVAVNAVHVLGKNVWIGGVLAFSYVFLPALRTGQAKSLAFALGTLSKLCSVAMAVGGVTGAYIVWLHLKAPANLLTTHWGLGLLTLLLFALLLAGLRLYHQCKLDPAAARAALGTKTTADDETLALAGYSLWTEAMTAIGVLFVSSSLIITTPPLFDGHVYQQHADSQGVSISFGEDRFDDGRMLIAAEKDGMPADVKNPTITLSNEREGIGPIVADAARVFQGGFALPKSLFSPPGTWLVAVTLPQPRGYDATATFTMAYPQDIEAAKKDGRTPDAFAWLCIAAATLLLGASILLRGHSSLTLSRVRVADDARKAPAVEMDVLWFVLAVNTVILLLLGYHGAMHASGGFAEACAKAGGMWHESVPMRDGKATSQTAVLGCMIGMGQGASHIADARTFVEFAKPAHAIADLDAPANINAGQPVTLTFSVTDLDGNPAESLAREHDRILHVIAVNEDLRTMLHAHPEDSGPVTRAMREQARFPVRLSFPVPGRYVVATDFTIRSTTASQEFYVDVTGAPPQRPAPDTARAGTFGGYDVTLDAPQSIVAKKPFKLSYRIHKDGKPVTDIRQYLAAPMHVAIVREDLRRLMHTHGELPQNWFDAVFTPRDPAVHPHVAVPERFGPDIVAYVTLPSAGRYVVFSEFLHDGKVVTTRFEIDAHE